MAQLAISAVIEGELRFGYPSGEPMCGSSGSSGTGAEFDQAVAVVRAASARNLRPTTGTRLGWTMRGRGTIRM
jgi:hypothetical protein